MVSSDGVYKDTMRHIRTRNITVEDGTKSTLRVGDNQRLYLGNGDAQQIYFDGTDLWIDGAGERQIKLNYQTAIVQLRTGNENWRTTWWGGFSSQGGKGVVYPVSDLSGTTGTSDGEVRLDDGTNTAHRGMPCVWDDVNSVWVKMDGTTFT